MTESSSSPQRTRYDCDSCLPHCRRPSPPSCCSGAMTAFRGVWTQEFWRCVGAEFLSTMLFVLLSVGATVNWGSADQDPAPPSDLVQISLAFGLAIATAVQCFSHLSGAHVNPAVTAAMVVSRRLSLAKGVVYLGAQCGGATVGAALLLALTPTAVSGALGVTTVNSGISTGSGLAVEFFITFQLVFTVFATCDPKRHDLKGSAALAIGLSVCVGHLFAIPYTGASMNPARSFGPAVVTWSWENHWVYWVGPILGAMLAAALYANLFCPDPQKTRRKRYSEVFLRTAFAAAKQRQDSVTAQEPLFSATGLDRGREKEVSQEVLSSV